MAGQARERNGGNITLIGIVPYGLVMDREKLLVQEGEINYGYKTRQPVNANYNYSDSPGDEVSLDPNHSHFLLVRGNKIKYHSDTRSDLICRWIAAMQSPKVQKSRLWRAWFEQLSARKI